MESEMSTIAIFSRKPPTEYSAHMKTPTFRLIPLQCSQRLKWLWRKGERENSGSRHCGGGYCAWPAREPQESPVRKLEIRHEILYFAHWSITKHFRWKNNAVISLSLFLFCHIGQGNLSQGEGSGAKPKQRLSAPMPLCTILTAEYSIPGKLTLDC